MDTVHEEFSPRRTTDFKQNFANSAWVWLGLVVYLVLFELFVLFADTGLESDPRSALFSWPSLAGFGVAGLVGTFLASRTGFPAAWDEYVSNSQRLLLPFAIGMGFGLVTTVVEQFTHSIEVFVALTGTTQFNVPFPGSLLMYPAGTILVETLYRLLPIPLLLWLISSILLRGRGQSQVFWGLAVLTSFIEPVTQDLASLPVWVPLFLSMFIPDYVFNFTQAVFFRRYGLLAAIFLRLGDYLVWHILYGNFVSGY